MGERRPVELVRLEQPEEVYEVESVFGRDAASVFPNMKAHEDPLEALKATIGAKRFVTETELEAIKAARGENVDDGTASADKPLAEVLAERKQAKQDAFEEQWREMKRGKNRPLEPDELEFLDAMARRQAEAEATIASSEAAELEAYRAAVAAAAEAKKQQQGGAAGAAAAAAAGGGGEDAAPGSAAGPDGGGGGADAEAGPGPGSSLLSGRSGSGGAPRQPAGGSRAAAAAGSSSKALVASLRPVVRVKPKGQAGAGTGSSGGSAAAGAAQQDAKRPRLDSSKNQLEQQQQQQQQQEVQGLAGLLGGYASDDSD